MGFLGSVYAVGNMTSAAVTSRGGALDNWDAKLKNIHEKYIKEEKAWVDYVKTNKFECYFVDKDPRKEIIPFWSYGPSKLANIAPIIQIMILFKSKTLNETVAAVSFYVARNFL